VSSIVTSESYSRYLAITIATTATTMMAAPVMIVDRIHHDIDSTSDGQDG
jgi:hypothetical protein